MPSDWEFIAPMVVGVTLIVTVGLTVMLRPVSKRLGDLLELMIQERRGKASPGEIERIATVLGTLESRMSLMEERQDFADSLLDRPGRKGLERESARG